MPKPVPKPIPTPRPVREVRWRFGLAASLLLVTGVIAVAVLVLTSGPNDVTPTPTTGGTTASIIDVVDGTLLVDDQIAVAGQDYPSGTILLDAGHSEFMVRSGATIVLRGRSRIDLMDSMHASMSLGEATFDCPPSAKGYTVHLPRGAKVVDIGTRFTVRVGDDGKATVRVLDGSIDASGIGGTARMTTGQSVVVEGGRLGEIVTEQRRVLLADGFDLGVDRADGARLDGALVATSADGRAAWRSDGADTRIVADRSPSADAAAGHAVLDDKARKVRLITLWAPIPDAGPDPDQPLTLRVDVNLRLASFAVVAIGDSGGGELALIIRSDGGGEFNGPSGSQTDPAPQERLTGLEPERWHTVEITIDHRHELASASINGRAIGDPLPVTIDPDRLALRSRVRGMHTAAFDNLSLTVGFGTSESPQAPDAVHQTKNAPTSKGKK